MIAAGAITYSAALIAFLLRLLARRIKGVPWNWGDYVALVAFVSGSCFGTFHG